MPMQINGPDAAEQERRGRMRIRVRSADALRREINSWVSELEHYGDCFTPAETAQIMELLKVSRALCRKLGS